MTIMQYQVLMSIKRIPTREGKGRINEYVVYQDKDGAAVIEGKIMVIDVEKILKQLPERSSFVKRYKNIMEEDITSNALATLRCYDAESFSVAIDVLKG